MEIESGGDVSRSLALPAKPRVVEVSFYLMSEIEIVKNLSVMEVTKHELYDSGNALITNASIAASVVNQLFGRQGTAPKLSSKLMAITNSSNVKNRIEMHGGLLDYRMGSTDRKIRCKTCDLAGGRNGCPGHFGHILLNYPVYLITTLPWCKTLLSFVCYFCSRLLINKSLLLADVPEAWDELSAEAKWERALNPKRRLTACPHGCMAAEGTLIANMPMPVYQVDRLRLVPNWSAATKYIEKHRKKANADCAAVLDQIEAIAKRPFTVADAWAILSAMHVDDLHFLGIQVDVDTGSGHPRNMILTCIPVEPKYLRPSACFDRGRVRSQDDKTHKYQEIIKANIAVGEAIRAATGGRYGRITPDMQLSMPQDILMLLQAKELALYEWHIATLFNNEIKGVKVDRQRSGKPFKSLSQFFRGKPGRWRQNTVAKRCDHSSRAVISSCASLDLDQLGVPVDICTINTIDTLVTETNIGNLYEAVQIGPGCMGGASHVIYLNGTEVDLKHCVDRSSIELEPGMIVCRYLRRDDYVMFNRQPTLHHSSIMAFRVVPVRDSTYRINMSVTTPFNADFDGDEMNMHVPQAVEERVETEVLMNVEVNLLSTQSSKLTMSLVQDALVAAWRMTAPNRRFTRTQAHMLLSQLTYFRADAFRRLGLPDDNTLYTGKQVYSAALFPEDFFYDRWRVSSPPADGIDLYDDHVVIRAGKLISGRLCKATMGTSGTGILYALCRRDSSYLVKLLSEAQRIGNFFLLAYDNFSIGPGDLVLPQATRQKVRAVIDTTLRKDTVLITDPIFNALIDNGHAYELEGARQKLAKRLMPHCAEIAFNAVSDLNGCKDVIACGSKGSLVNIGQMAACVGQQTVDGTRLSKGRLPCFAADAKDAVAQGLIKHSLMHGLNPHEFFHHCQAGREGLVDTAVKTAGTGYIQRRIVRATENICIDDDYTVRTWDGGILQERYGGDSWAPNRLVKLGLPYMQQPTDEDALAALFNDAVGDQPCQEYVAQYEQLKDPLQRLRKLRTNAYYKAGTVPVDEFCAPLNIQKELSAILLLSDKSAPLGPDAVCAFVEHMLGWIRRLDEWLLDNLTCGYYIRASLLIRQLVRRRVSADDLDRLLRCMLMRFKEAVCCAGTPVGPLAAESIGEPTTQMTLDTFHFCGVQTSKLVTSGVPRMQELVALQKTINMTTMTIAFKEPYAHDKAFVRAFRWSIVNSHLESFITRQPLRAIFDPEPLEPCQNHPEINAIKTMYDIFVINARAAAAVVQATSRFGVYAQLDKGMLQLRGLTARHVADLLRQKMGCSGLAETCLLPEWIVMVSETAGVLYFRPPGVYKNLQAWATAQYKSVDSQEALAYEQDLCYQAAKLLAASTAIHGIKGIESTHVRMDSGQYVIDTVGSNLLEVLSLDVVDPHRTTTNNLYEIEAVLGIDAAADALFYEYKLPLDTAGSSIYNRHLLVVTDLQCLDGNLKAMTRHGINQSYAPLTQIAFEESVENMYKAALFSKKDSVCDVASSVMMGQNIPLGTGKVGFEYTALPQQLQQPHAREFQVTPTNKKQQQRHHIAFTSGATLCTAEPVANSNVVYHVLSLVYANYNLQPPNRKTHTNYLPCPMPVSLQQTDLSDTVSQAAARYTVREKTDGSRYLLVLSMWDHVPGAWLINRNCEVFPVAVAAPISYFAVKTGSMYDVELVRTSEEKTLLLVLDAVVQAGASLLASQWHNRYRLIHRTFTMTDYTVARLGTLAADDTFDGIIRDEILSQTADGAQVLSRDPRVVWIEPKSCYALSDISAVVRKTKNLTQTAVPCDGLILQPLDGTIKPYKDETMFKWKLAASSTIDVLYGRDCDLYLYDTTKKQHVPCAEALGVAKVALAAHEYPVMSILECTVLDRGEELVLVPQKVRNKSHPNSVAVANSTLHYIRNPVNLEDICAAVVSEQQLQIQQHTAIPDQQRQQQLIRVYRPPSPGLLCDVVTSAPNRPYRPPSPVTGFSMQVSYDLVHEYPDMIMLTTADPLATSIRK